MATQALVDVNGNLLLDGTAVMFVITGEDGTERRLPAQLIDGKATVQLQAPALPGALHVKALVLNTSSTPLTLDFSAGIGVAPIALRMIPDAETLTLIAGPLLGPLGQYISDGSEVLFTLQATDNSGVPIRVTVPAVAGFAAAVLRRSLLSADTYTVHVDAGVGEGETIIQP
ncbi:MAG: hypothetical protein R2867_06290 [Caldilineaceae bacterium]